MVKAELNRAILLTAMISRTHQFSDAVSGIADGNPLGIRTLPQHFLSRLNSMYN
jgi:hypothetical protein